MEKYVEESGDIIASPHPPVTQSRFSSPAALPCTPGSSFLSAPAISPSGMLTCCRPGAFSRIGDVLGERSPPHLALIRCPRSSAGSGRAFGILPHQIHRLENNCSGFRVPCVCLRSWVAHVRPAGDADHPANPSPGGAPCRRVDGSVRCEPPPLVAGLSSSVGAARLVSKVLISL